MIDPDKLDEALRLLNATLHEQLLATGLVTVEQWNAEIAPRMMAVASISVGSPVHARSYRVHESIYPPRAKAAEQDGAPAEIDLSVVYARELLNWMDHVAAVNDPNRFLLRILRDKLAALPSLPADKQEAR